MVEFAFDSGITHFDLANNYGPPYGSAEEMFGRIYKESLKSHRDEILITTKAGHDMWPGPYGEWGSRKNLFASLDQSLKRMGLDYVDIFYSHRPDPNTPLEETMQALVDIVRSGKALYVGISKYPQDMAEQAYAYLREQKVPCLVYQGRYSMLDRAVEEDVLEGAAAAGAGFVAFSPLAQGLLTDKYLNGIPEGSRMTVNHFLKKDVLTDDLVAQLKAWNEEAAEQGLSLAQYALKWILRRPEVTSVIVGASSVEQLKNNLEAIK
ncbi:MAG: aldo/keto reductase [Bacteroidales bacterium]|nr:aldo/keto reductase [Bacteroidales bacterium]